MSKKLIWLTSGLFVALLVVAGGIAGLLLTNQSQDVRQQAASPTGTVNFTLSKATMTLQPSGTDTFQILINTNGARLSGFGYRLVYPSISGITVEGQEKNSALLGVACTFTDKEVSGQQTIGANCTTDGLVDYSNSEPVPIATITLKAGTQGTNTPVMVTFDMSNSGEFITANDRENTDLAAIPTGSLAVTVTKPAASANANLSSLGISQGSLSPSFAPATLSYTTSVANSVSSLTLTPVAEDATATIKVNGTVVASGQASTALSLNVGSNTITTEVTAPDTTTKKNYVITVTRAAAEQTSSSTINLSSTQTCNPNELKAKIEIKENSQPKNNVKVEFEFNNEKKTATTNTSGVAETTFGLPAAGTYSLKARPESFDSKEASIQITSCASSTSTSTSNQTSSTTIVQCNQTCNASRTCSAGLSCVGGVCRNTTCQADTTCTCKGGGNIASQSGTSTLPSTGSVDRTLTLILIGSLLALGGGQMIVSRLMVK